MIMQVSPMPSLKTLERRLKGIKGGAEKVMRRAIDNTVRHTQSSVAKATQKEYIVKAADVKKSLVVRRPKGGNPTGEVISRTDHKMKLYQFRVSPKQADPSAPPKFFQAQVKRGNGKENLEGSSDRSKAFVAKMKSGHVGVFERQLGKKAKYSRGEPIAELYGPSVASAIRDLKVSKPLLDDARQYLWNQIEQQTRRLLEK